MQVLDKCSALSTLAACQKGATPPLWIPPKPRSRAPRFCFAKSGSKYRAISPCAPSKSIATRSQMAIVNYSAIDDRAVIPLAANWRAMELCGTRLRPLQNNRGLGAYPQTKLTISAADNRSIYRKCTYTCKSRDSEKTYRRGSLSGRFDSKPKCVDGPHKKTRAEICSTRVF